MSSSNYPACLAFTLKFEGGRSDDPQDPGGKTNRGITQATYDAYRDRNGVARSDVYSISEQELQAIYRHEYWDKVNGDGLRMGEDLVVFDLAVNSGPARALRMWQAAGGARVPLPDIIHKLCADRLAFLQSLGTWQHFGPGWGRRVASAERLALGMSGAPLPMPKLPSSSKKGGAVIAAGGAAAWLAHYLSGGELHWAIAIFACVVSGAILMSAMAKFMEGKPAIVPPLLPAPIPDHASLPSPGMPSSTTGLDAAIADLTNKKTSFEAAISSVVMEKEKMRAQIKNMEAAAAAVEGLLARLGMNRQPGAQMAVTGQVEAVEPPGAMVSVGSVGSSLPPA